MKDFNEWLNRPCPLCGESVLTEDDYENAMKFHKSIELINSLSEEELTKMTENIDLVELKNSGMLKDLIS